MLNEKLTNGNLWWVVKGGLKNFADPRWPPTGDHLVEMQRSNNEAT